MPRAPRETLHHGCREEAAVPEPCPALPCLQPWPWWSRTTRSGCSGSRTTPTTRCSGTTPRSRARRRGTQRRAAPPSRWAGQPVCSGAAARLQPRMWCWLGKTTAPTGTLGVTCHAVGKAAATVSWPPLVGWLPNLPSCSSGPQVCHVDSGVRVDHPDLAANVLKGWNFVPPGQVGARFAHPPACPAHHLPCTWPSIPCKMHPQAMPSPAKKVARCMQKRSAPDMSCQTPDVPSVPA